MRKIILSIFMCFCLCSPVILSHASEVSETQSVAEQPAESEPLAESPEEAAPADQEEVNQEPDSTDLQEEESADVQESQETEKTEQQTEEETETETETDEETTVEEDTAVQELLEEQFTEYVQLLSDTAESYAPYDDTELLSVLDDLTYCVAALCLLVSALLLYLIIHNILKGNK